MTQYKVEPPSLFDKPYVGLVNSSVPTEDELRLSTQCVAMYRRLLRGPATNVELQKLTGSMNPTARRTDIRNELREHGWDLVKTRNLGGGVNEYEIQKEGKVQ